MRFLRQYPFNRRVLEGMALFNEEMLKSASNRPHIRGLWGIGLPFDVESSSAVEAKMDTGFSGGFKFGVNKKPWTDEGGNTWRRLQFDNR